MRSSQTRPIVHGVLWGSAILASALTGGPPFLTLILLPILGFAAVGTLREGRG